MDARTRWAVWLGATVGSFMVLEAQALKEPLTDEKPSGTLTAALRWWLGVQPAGRRRWPASVLFAAFWLWLIGHITLGWPPNDLPRRRVSTSDRKQETPLRSRTSGDYSGYDTPTC